MLRTIRRLTLIAGLGVALLGLCVPAVQAAPPGFAPTASATTEPATHVGITSAVLNGVIETRGQRTQWEFQYGARTVHDYSTPVRTIPAGQGTVHVSATIAGLQPRTTYYFRVIAISGIGSNYVEVYYAQTLTFKTRAWNGSALLTHARLPVSRGRVRTRLMCASNQPCVGSFAITTSSASGLVVCAAKSFRIGAGARRTVKAAVSQPCLALLQSAPNHRLKARFSSATTSGQRGQNRSVKLVLI